MKENKAGWIVLATAMTALNLAPCVIGIAHAADEQRQTLEEVVVTAERRAISVNEVPLAISAVSGDTLRSQNVVNFSQIVESLANVNFSSIAQVPRIFIRGVGLDALAPGADPRVAVYTDEVYNARVAGAFSSFYDLERIEVLRGPQGTLYGRNATAGAVNIITRDPGSTLNGYGKVVLGNYGYVQTEGAVGGPLSDAVGGRLAFQSTDHTGWGTNISTGAGVDDEHKRSVRGKLVIKASDTVTVRLGADYMSEDDAGGGAFHFLHNAPGYNSDGLRDGFVVPANLRDVAGVQPHFKLKNYGAVAQIDAVFGASTLTSVTGYRNVDSYLIQTSDGTTGNYAPTQFEEHSKSFTQELRWKTTVGVVDTLLGAYYFHEKNSALTLSPLHWRLFSVDFCALAQLPQPCDPLSQKFLAQAYDAGGDQKTDAYAFFTQETVHITEALGLDLGVRYSSERRQESEHFQFDLSRLYTGSLTYDEFASPRFVSAATQDQSRTWTSTDWKVNLHYQMSKSLLLYATSGTAFKSGGFNLGGMQAPFNPEAITTVEVGVKVGLPNHRMNATFAAFHYDYKNLQVNYTVQNQILTANAAKAKVEGFEAEITALPVDDLQLKLNVSVLNGKYAKYSTEDPGRPNLGTIDLTGNKLQYAPDLKLNGDVAYSIHTSGGTLTPRLSVMWTAKQYMSQFNLPFVEQDSYMLTNAYLDFDSGHGWTASAFLMNAADKQYTVAQNQTSLFIGNQIFGQLGAPRTFGVSFTKSF